MRKKLVAALLFMCATTSAHAQEYPSRPVTVVIGLAAGGAVDLLMRTIAEHMRGTLGQTIVIENVSGAGGTVATGRVVRATPDGYTLGMGSMGQYVIDRKSTRLNSSHVSESRMPS